MGADSIVDAAGALCRKPALRRCAPGHKGPHVPAAAKIPPPRATGSSLRRWSQRRGGW